MDDATWFGILERAGELSMLVFAVSAIGSVSAPRYFRAGFVLATLLPLVLCYYAFRHGERLVAMNFETSVAHSQDGLAVLFPSTGRVRVQSSDELWLVFRNGLLLAAIYALGGAAIYFTALPQ